MSEKPNIVQVEFFLVDTNPSRTLSEVEGEAQSRARGGAQIKECVRFYDDGAIVDVIKRAQRAHERSSALWQKYARAGYFRRILVNSGRKYEEIVRKGLRDRARELCVSRIEKLARTTKELAIERAGHSFTMARPNELHELVESIKKSNGMWFFVFKPNTLTSDTNTMLAHSM